MRDAVVFPSIKRFRMYRQKRFEYTTGGHVFKNIRILVDGAKVNNHVGKSEKSHYTAIISFGTVGFLRFA